MSGIRVGHGAGERPGDRDARRRPGVPRTSGPPRRSPRSRTSPRCTPTSWTGPRARHRSDTRPGQARPGAARRPAEGLPDGPYHRDQRQDLDGAHDRAARARARPAHGRFTSPHLTSVTERIAIDGESVTPARFVEIWEDVAPYIGVADRESEEAGGPRLSFFEVLTVMAFAAFADTPVDVAIVEVGMGGGWDSTNVVDGDVAVVTPSRSTTPAGSGTRSRRSRPRSPGSSRRARSSCSPSRATPPRPSSSRRPPPSTPACCARPGHRGGGRTPPSGQVVDLRTPQACTRRSSCRSSVSTRPATPCWRCRRPRRSSPGRALDGGVVEAAFGDASSPGRLEVLRSSPTVIVDAAHNPAGAEALVAAIEESFEFEHLIGVVAIMGTRTPSRSSRCSSPCSRRSSSRATAPSVRPT
ncbi:cyanophycin synthetase [Oerskovia sp. M15]